jgi:hypothetical protein
VNEEQKEKVAALFPAGHYYSPVVDPSTVGAYFARERKQNCEDLAAININQAGMRALWQSFAKFGEPNFNETRGEGRRYFVDNGNYGFSDACVLRALIGWSKPRRIVEIGSGNSTACMLDSLDEFGLTQTRITGVEPYPHRLNAIMRPSDSERLRIIKKPVQELPLSVFSELKENDILFVDSTHVLKTGSDVHFELFRILPIISDGVLVHFHDCPFPFEYPPKWVLHENRSWNEVYALRAFLMYNNAFEIIFWTTLMVDKHSDVFRSTIRRMLDNPVGSGIWLRKVGKK